MVSEVIDVCPVNAPAQLSEICRVTDTVGPKHGIGKKVFDLKFL